MRVAILSMALGGLWLAGAALSQEVAGDPASGRKLAGQCRTCHGIEGAAKMPAPAAPTSTASSNGLSAPVRRV